MNKPSGLLTQAPPGIDSLEFRIRCFLAAQRGVPLEDVYLGIPHRLDRPASGAMLFALRKRMARKLSKQFERRQIKKTYWACATGEVKPPAGIWEDFMRKLPGVAEAEIVPREHPQAQRARLRYRTLAATWRQSWLEIQLETGRTHQIRVQAAWRGYPLLGDRQYGSVLGFGAQLEDPRERAIALHAHSIQFRHPGLARVEGKSGPTSISQTRPSAGGTSAWTIAGEIVTVVAPPPASWRDLGSEES
ncbi:MAG: RNA pseudouridine synthase [Pirellulales bacterium]|nr:RNA pseudouridine synthase [Pirellulales bacterium]